MQLLQMNGHKLTVGANYVVKVLTICSCRSAKPYPVKWELSIGGFNYVYYQ